MRLCYNTASLWVCSNLSMPKLGKIDIIHILSCNFWTTSQNSTKLGTDIVETLYFTPAQVAPPSHHDATDDTPWWPRLTLLHSQHIPNSSGVLCQTFIESTQWLWNHAILQPSEGLFPSVASKHSSLITSSHGSTWPSGSDCCSDSSTHETPSKLAINLAHDPILQLEHHRAIWWFPAVS